MNLDLSPLYISLKTSILSTIITFFIGIIVSYKMSEYDGKFKGLIDGLLTLPLILPPTVIGFFLLLICGKNGPIGKFLNMFDINKVEVKQNELLTISAFAKLVGMPSSTIRYWVNNDKLKPHSYTDSGYMLFAKAQIKEVQNIKQ